MELDMSFVEAMIWFFGGIFMYRFVSKMLGYGHMINLYRDNLFSVLMLLKIADNNFERANLHLYESAVNSGKDEKEANLEHEANTKVLEVWRSLVIATIQQVTPKGFRALVKFNNWQQAMQYLDNKEGR